MILSLLGWLPNFILKWVDRFYTKKLDHVIEEKKLSTELAIESIRAEIAIREAQKEVLAKDIEHWEVRFLRFVLFGSVTLWLSLIFLYSALGITPDVQAVLDIPEEFRFIPYAIVGYWTLDRMKRK